MSPILRRAAAAALAVGLLFVTSACSSDSSSTDKTDATTPAGSGADASTVDSTDDAVAETGSTVEASGDSGLVVTDCAADQEAGIAAETLSRSVAVLFSADSTSGVSFSDITPETTMTIQTDGTLMPDTLTVAVGQVFGIMPADGADLDAVKIGCADAQTLLPGSPAGFVITQPGTYPISLEIAGTALGTVTAQ